MTVILCWTCAVDNNELVPLHYEPQQNAYVCTIHGACLTDDDYQRMVSV